MRSLKKHLTRTTPVSERTRTTGKLTLNKTSPTSTLEQEHTTKSITQYLSNYAELKMVLKNFHDI